MRRFLAVAAVALAAAAPSVAQTNSGFSFSFPVQTTTTLKLALTVNGSPYDLSSYLNSGGSAMFQMVWATGTGTVHIVNASSIGVATGDPANVASIVMSASQVADTAKWAATFVAGNQTWTGTVLTLPFGSSASATTNGVVTAAAPPPASASSIGGVMLAGDLSGTASAPQVVAAHLAAPLPQGQGGSGAGSLGAATVTPTGASTARPLADKLRDVVSVKDFGCVCDGSTVDTVCVQTISTAFGSTPTTVEVHGTGSCVVNSNVTIPSTTTVRFKNGGSFSGSGTVSYTLADSGAAMHKSNSNSPNALVALNGTTPAYTANNSKAQVQLYLTDSANPDPNATAPQAALGFGVTPFAIYTASSGLPRLLFAVGGTGGVFVHDYIGLCPATTGQNDESHCQGAGGAMMSIGSDLGAGGADLEMIADPTNTFIRMNALVGNGAFDTGTRKFTFDGNGFQNSSQKNIVRNSAGATDCAAANLTPTVAAITTGTIYTCATSQSLTLPTAQGVSGIVQALPGKPAVGDVFQLKMAENHATNTFTLIAGTGGTIFGIATITNGARTWDCRITSVTSGSETFTCY